MRTLDLQGALSIMRTRSHFLMCTLRKLVALLPLVLVALLPLVLVALLPLVLVALLRKDPQLNESDTFARSPNPRYALQKRSTLHLVQQ